MLPDLSVKPCEYQYRCICVGKVRRAQVLSADVAEAPVDLVAAWHDGESGLQARVRAVISELFTDMQLWKVGALLALLTLEWVGSVFAQTPLKEQCTAAWVAYIQDV